MPHRLFLLLAGATGLVLVFLTPPFQVADEPAHFLRAYQISEGRLLSQRLPDGGVSGGNLPISVIDTSRRFDYLIMKPTREVHLDDVRRSLRQPLDPDRRASVGFANTAVYPPVPYLPQAGAIFLGRLAHAPPLALLYLARLASLGTVLLLVARSIRLLPIGKWSLFVLATTPMSVSLAASSSVDGPTTAVAFLTGSVLVAAMLRRGPLRRREFLVLSGTAVALALCKQPFFLLVLLVFAIPPARCGSVRRWLTGGIAITVLATTLTGGWAKLVGTPAHQVGVDAAAQLRHIAAQPLDYLVVLARTYLTTSSDNLVVVRYVGWLGWLDLPLPLWLVTLVWVLIAAVLLLGSERSPKPAGWQRLVAALVAVVAAVATTTLLYLTWTAPAARTVAGLQDRYFISLSILLIPAVGGLCRVPTTTQLRIAASAAAGMTAVSICTLGLVGLRYYG